MDTKNINQEPVQNSDQPSQGPIKEIHHHHYRKRGGGVGRLFFGLIFLIVGFIFLAQNLGWMPVVGFNFGYLFKIWPVFIILLGLSVLSRGTWVGSILAVIFTFVIVGLVVAAFFWPSSPPRTSLYNFDIAKESSASSSEIFIKAGAAVVSVGSSTTSLAVGSLESNITNLTTSSKIENNVQQAIISTEGNIKGFFGKVVNNLKVNISQDLPVSLNIDSGASKLDIDLSDVLLKSLNLNSGASKLSLVLGDKLSTSSVNISSGASSIDITLPETVGARVNSKGGLTSRNFSNFSQLAENSYESSNYASSTSKLDITIDAGVSSVSIGWR